MLTRAPSHTLETLKRLTSLTFLVQWRSLIVGLNGGGGREELQGFTAKECENLEFSGKLITLSGNVAVEQG